MHKKDVSKQTNSSAENDKVELLIIGSGASASIIAAKVAQAGKQVLMLEAGPKRQLTDLTSSQIWARKLKWGGATVQEQGSHKIGHNFNAGWGTGGGTVHHYGVWPRLHENDFKIKSQYGMGNDWPVDYQDLRPAYDQVQTELGISGDAKAEKWRPKGKDYPMPPLPVFAQGKVIAKGFEAKGLHTAPIPLAINSRPYNNRPACIFDGWCDAGCPTGALANALTHYLPQAQQEGARIKHDSTVTKILTNKTGKKVIGVEYSDEQGNKYTQMADVVVVAAFAVQTSRLLLASANSQHPNGLSNSNELVGRYLMTHPASSTYGLFDEPTEPHLGATGGQLINHDHYDDKMAVTDAYGSYQWLIANALKPNDLLGIANTRPDIYGKKLDGFMRKAAKNMGNMVYVAEDIPQYENRVQLSKETDQFGVPLALATHNMDSKTKALCDTATAQGKDIFTAAGAKEVWSGPLIGMHVMGGTIMGVDEKSSVTNRYGQCHEINNLFVAGSSLFPSSGAVNPTFTIHALGLQSAEYILSEWADLIN